MRIHRCKLQYKFLNQRLKNRLVNFSHRRLFFVRCSFDALFKPLYGGGEEKMKTIPVFVIQRKQTFQRALEEGETSFSDFSKNSLYH